jgi:nicotinamide riboside transporter PnuC
MVETLGVIATILAVGGVILNNRRLIGCFGLWIVSNFLSMLIHLQTHTWSLAVRDLIFIVLAIEGIWLWRKRPLKGLWEIRQKHGLKISNLKL